ncbi:hypothetical protein BH18ACT5_BH18ACT5_03790 [soil metagenome]
MAHSIQVVVACENPGKLAGFWAGALDYILQPPPEGFDSWDAFADKVGIPEEMRNDFSAVVDPEEKGPRIVNAALNSPRNGPGSKHWEQRANTKRLALLERSGSRCLIPKATGSACNDP